MNSLTDPSDFEQMDDYSLEDSIRRFCRKITDIDDETLKPLRNALEEILSRWKSCKVF